MELLGTFFLVLVIGLTALAPGGGVMAPLAIGTILMALVYAGGPISGAHYNPAVTLAVWMRGKCDARDVPRYMIAQVAGAMLAAVTVAALRRGQAVIALEPHIVPAFVIEFLFTFVLAYVVLHVATSRRAAGNSYFGLAIGLTVTAAAYAGGDISGGAFNPAVVLGATFLGLIAPADVWIFLVANLAGGALAALAFRTINPDDPS